MGKGGAPRTAPDDSAILGAITTLSEQGFPPTVDELATALGLGKSSTWSHLVRLRDEGRVTWQAGHTRTLRVVSPS